MSLASIKSDLEDARSAEQANAVFKSAYAAGWTLQELGDIVGLSRERIRQRISKPVALELMRTYEPVGRVRKAEMRHASTRRKKTRILGLPLSSPVMNVPVRVLNELAVLHEQVTEVRGWTPLDSPSRAAIKPYGDLLAQVIRDHGIPQTHLERALGLKGVALTAWLRRHGYYHQYPSQRSFTGVLLVPAEHAQKRRGRTKLVPGAECFHGHVLTEALIGTDSSSGQKYCRQCRRDQQAVRNARKRKAVSS